MRGQWGLIFGLIAALIIAFFAVVNVEPVRVNYVFGMAEWPLILVILGSVLMGGIIIGSVGIVKVFQLQQEIKRLKKRAIELEQDKQQADQEIEQLKHAQSGPTKEEEVKAEQMEEDSKPGLPT